MNMSKHTPDKQPVEQNQSPANPGIWKRAAMNLALIGLGSGMVFAGGYVGSQQSQLARDVSNVAVGSANAAPIVPPVESNFVTGVVNRVGDAVVRIDASRTVRSRIPAEFNDPFFRRFFGEIPSTGRQRVERGTGSGFIISQDGQILTNAHVVNGADRVRITLRNGRTFEGRVLGTDELTDVAVVKIDATNLPTVRLANSEQIQAGEWAIAIGNPLGLDNTVTTGIVSATGRRSNQIGASDRRVSYIQTDAAINPGNSGGPLLNARGEVIGMNTAIIQGAQGLGFAIPINTAQRIAQQIITYGQAQHPYLGIQMVTLSPEIRQDINSDPQSGIRVNEDRGILIFQVAPNSPAARAGIRPGDIITRVNGNPVTTTDNVQRAVENSQIGQNLSLELRRNGQTLNLAVQPGNFPTQNARR